MSGVWSNTVSARFFDGRKPIPEPVTLIWSGANVRLVGTAMAQTFPSNRLRVSPRVGTADRFVALPDGTQLQCADHPVLDRLPQEGKTEGVVAWLERRWSVAFVCLVAAIAGLAAGYVYGLPAAAEHIAKRIPIEHERKLGDQAVSWMDQNKMFQPSGLPAELRRDVSEGFTTLTKDLPLAAHYRLEFRRAPAVGPNAFALPGGIIVITDEMVNLSESVDEVLAVLAHEIGHVERRHALRHVLQDSAVAALAATFTSDASSLTLAVSGLPVLIARTKYSRAFETEADDFGFALLKRHDLSPEHFATLMQRLSTETGETDEHEKDDQELSFLSTHPVTAERIARARAAAKTK